MYVKKFLRKAFLLFTFFSSGILTAQTTFQKNFGTGPTDYLTLVRQTSDGGYMVAGNQSISTSSNANFCLVKMDSSSNISWAKTYGNAYINSLVDAIQTNDGGFMLAGNTRLNAANYELLLVKTDANGDTLYTKTFSSYRNEGAQSLIQTSDGGYLVAGSQSILNGGFGICLLKLNASGDSTWSAFLHGPTQFHYETVRDIAQTSDGGYILGGDYSFGQGWADFYLLKLDASGAIQWSKTYGTALNDYGMSVSQTTDGGYILGGNSATAPNISNLMLIRTNSIGDTLWTATYGGIGHEDWGIAQQTTDGGFIIGGNTQSFLPSGMGAYLVKTNANGILSWSKTYGGNSFDQFYYVSQAGDGGYLAGGSTSSFGAAGYKYLVKTDSLGNSNCAEITPATITYHPLVTVGSTPLIASSAPQGSFSQLSSVVANSIGSSNTICFIATAIPKQIDSKERVELFPNPTSGLMQINYQTTFLKANEIRITDCEGRILDAFKIPESSSINQIISFSGFENGLYFVQILSNEKIINTTKFIKAE